MEFHSIWNPDCGRTRSPSSPRTRREALQSADQCFCQRVDTKKRWIQEDKGWIYLQTKDIGKFGTEAIVNYSTFVMMNSITQLKNHEAKFEQAWADPRNTCCELPPIDVNQVLAEHYNTSEPFTFTRAMLWDMETKKAWAPDRYLPAVVRQGTASA